MKRTITALALVAFLAAAPHQADAQASIAATATVATALSVTGGNDLNFQTVIPTYTKTVLVTDATAGTFSLAGGSGAEVTLSFTALPANLAGPGGNLPITYDGVHNTVNDPAAGATGFVPVLGLSATTTLSAGGDLYVFLGGQVDAALQGTPGVYSGTVTLDAAYTGN